MIKLDQTVKNNHLRIPEINQKHTADSKGCLRGKLLNVGKNSKVCGSECGAAPTPSPRLCGTAALRTFSLGARKEGHLFWGSLKTLTLLSDSGDRSGK